MSDQGRRVLVVDDDADIRAAVCEVLGDWQPDVILLDLAMPEMDGWDFLAEQQAHLILGQIPVIVMSGRQNLGRQALPAADVLPKPFILSRLLDRLEQLTRG